jgi:hypothetical protein
MPTWVIPGAIALHKAWLTQQPHREPIKKPSDLAQARAVAATVREFLPHGHLIKG